MQWVIAALLIVPGVMGIADLHPYEYVYFNTYTDGIEGAAGEYDLEYCCTSYRDAMEYVNRVAGLGTTVLIRSQILNATPYKRPDLRVTRSVSAYDDASYVVLCRRYPQDYIWTNGTNVYEVSRGPAIFAEVFRID